MKDSYLIHTSIRHIRARGGAFGRLLGAWLLVAAVSVAVDARAADQPLGFRNRGMEEGAGRPEAWQQGPSVPGVELLWDQKTAHGGKASLCLKKTAQRYFPIAYFSQSVSVEPSQAARKVRVRCWVKAEATAKAIIDVTYQGEGQRPGHAWAVYLGQKQDGDPLLTHDWKRYDSVVDVPAGMSKVGIAFQIYGPGSVWFDDLEVAWVGEGA